MMGAEEQASATKGDENMSMPEEVNPCTIELVTEPGYIWYRGMPLHLVEEQYCYNGISVARKGGETLITLPPGRKFDIAVGVEAINDTLNPARVDVEFRSKNKITQRETARQKNSETYAKINYRIRHETPKDETDNVMVIKLSAPERLTHVRSNVFITIRRE